MRRWKYHAVVYFCTALALPGLSFERNYGFQEPRTDEQESIWKTTIKTLTAHPIWELIIGTDRATQIASEIFDDMYGNGVD